jgi:beta-glucosidase
LKNGILIYLVPLWFTHLGAFERRDNIDHFVRYTEFLVAEYSSKVKKWFTFVDPNIHITQAYMLGKVPPYKRNVTLTAEVFTNVVDSHVKSYNIVKVIRLNH